MKLNYILTIETRRLNMEVQVYHSQNVRDTYFYRENGDIFNKEQARALYLSHDIEKGYLRVADFDINNRLFEDETDILDMIYNDSQNEDADWRTRRQRSTSVGDIIVLDSKVFIVASCGFDAIY